jgi:hypothetical protein
MLTRVTLDEKNEKYAGVVFSNAPRPSELPVPRTLSAPKFPHASVAGRKRAGREVCHGCDRKKR